MSGDDLGVEPVTLGDHIAVGIGERFAIESFDMAGYGADRVAAIAATEAERAVLARLRSPDVEEAVARRFMENQGRHGARIGSMYRESARAALDAVAAALRPSDHAG